MASVKYINHFIKGWHRFGRCHFYFSHLPFFTKLFRPAVNQLFPFFSEKKGKYRTKGVGMGMNPHVISRKGRPPSGG